jgi:Tfp pilus assembly protein PilF
VDARIQKAHLLLQQSRFDLAERELRASLARDPENWLPHALLAVALMRQGRREESVREAREAAGREPGIAYAHYVLALTLSRGGDRKSAAEARDAAGRALELEPGDPDHHVLAGWMDLEEKRWGDALAGAEKALALDPEHVDGANLRAQALVKLGRGSEAGATLESALARDPESDTIHANMGWTLLERGEHRRAVDHFREALRLDPDSEWAREGIVEAMKARNPAYRAVLRYFFWMGKLKGRTQWLLILGAVFGTRFLRSLTAEHPALRPAAFALTALYVLFVAATWLAKPLFDLLLRFDAFGRRCLSEDQVRASNWLGAALALALAFLAASLATGSRPLLFAALGCLGLCLPVTGLFQVRDPGRRRVHAGIAAGLALCGLGALALPGPQPLLGMIFAGGIVAYSWLANAYK